MNRATLVSRALGEAGKFLTGVSQGALISAGLLALSVQAAGYIEHGRLSLDIESAFGRAQAAELAFVPADDPVEEQDVALSKEMARVQSFVARRYRVSRVALEPLLAEAEQTGRQLGLDPLLLVAMMAIESSFNPMAESVVGAQGLMQVIPRFHMDKIGKTAGDDAGADALFDPQTNIRVGALVLKEGLRRFGSMQSALQYYGGALGDPQAGYANRVLGMKERLRQAARRTNSA